MNKELMVIRESLKQKSEREAYKLWKLARRATAHGCKPETIDKIREEADWCYRTGTAYPERVIKSDLECRFQYAFKC